MYGHACAAFSAQFMLHIPALWLAKSCIYRKLCMCEHVIATYNICYIVLVQLKVWYSIQLAAFKEPSYNPHGRRMF